VKRRNGINLVTYYDQEAAYATEFRRLLHSVNGAVASDKTSAIMVTSALLSEGKSTIVSFLAITAARQKRYRTLLIDCDLRRPSLHHLFAVDRENGVSEVLAENYKPRDVIKRTAEPNLDLITAGKAVDQPTDIFDAAAIQQMIRDVAVYYEFVLVDCAPLLPVSDPMLLAQAMDGVIMVVKAGSTQREIARRAATLLKSNDINFLGVVVNNADNVLPHYYNDSYYGYEYKPRSKK
jgi:capsular exopolysaccharide synthesis family protein